MTRIAAAVCIALGAIRTPAVAQHEHHAPAGKPVRLRFRLRDAEVYAFQFAE